MQVDLFSVTAPLLLQLPDGSKHVLAEVFPHPDGLLFFELFWHLAPNDEGVHLIEGRLHGDGPWRVGDTVIRVLGCNHTDPEVAADYAAWQDYLSSAMAEYPEARMRNAIARRFGALV